MTLKHSSVCPIQAEHTEDNCPMLTVPGTIMDFVKYELSNPLRAAKWVIFGVIAGIMIWAIVAMALVL